MPTRLEALHEALTQIDESIEGIDNRIEAAAQLLEASNSEHAQAVRNAINGHGEYVEAAADTVRDGMVTASENLAESIEDAGSDIKDGLMIGGVLLAGAYVFSTLLTSARSRAAADRQYVEMFDSIVCLFDRYGSALAYDFVVERSYAEGTTVEDRQTIINGYIHYGVIADNHLGDPELLYLDPGSDHVLSIYSLFEDEGLILLPDSP